MQSLLLASLILITSLLDAAAPDMNLDIRELRTALAGPLSERRRTRRIIF